MNDYVSVNIKDQGKGFNWREYIKLSANQSNDFSGRGIALAKVMSFDNMEYIDPGNQVIVKVFT